jgi:hypothetical protein
MKQQYLAQEKGWRCETLNRGRKGNHNIQEECWNISQMENKRIIKGYHIQITLDAFTTEEDENENNQKKKRNSYLKFW